MAVMFAKKHLSNTYSLFNMKYRKKNKTEKIWRQRMGE